MMVLNLLLDAAGLNTSVDYEPDGLVVWPYEGIFLGIGTVSYTHLTLPTNREV